MHVGNRGGRREFANRHKTGSSRGVGAPPATRSNSFASLWASLFELLSSSATYRVVSPLGQRQ